MASYGRKKSFNEKMTDLKGKLKRAFIMTAIGGAAIGGPLYYNYGTVHEQDVKIKEVKEHFIRYDEKKGSIYEYQIITDKGMVLANKNTLLHLKFNSKDIQDQLSDGRSSWIPWDETPDQKKERETNSPANKTYHIKYYGARIDLPLIHKFPNLLSVREVSQEELQARAKAAAEARAAQQQALGQKPGQQQPGQNGQPVTTNPQGTTQQQAVASGALSGTMITFETVANGQKISMTVPIEAADKITINSVKPLVPTGPKAPGGQ